MWKRNKVWIHYVKNIIAADIPSAVFLSSYLRHSKLSGDYANYLEIIDLQKYKMISKPARVKIALQDKKKLPFIFLVGKN